jgi:hypothetical protein
LCGGGVPLNFRRYGCDWPLTEATWFRDFSGYEYSKDGVRDVLGTPVAWWDASAHDFYQIKADDDCVPISPVAVLFGGPRA